MPDLYMDVDTALSEVPVNLMPLLDDTDFKTRETAIAYNAAGMDLVWNFVTTGGAFTQTAVTPTTGGTYDWTHQGDGIYTIEIPASGGASINNDTEGFGWFTGLVTGVLPWRGPTIGFRAAGLNDALIDGAYSTTRGLAGTALPNAAAEAAGGLFTRGTGAGQINQAANGQVDVNAVALSGDAAAADNAEAFFDGTGYAGTNNVIPTVTNLTNLPAITSNWLTAAGIASGALNGKGDWNIGKTGYALSSAGVQAIWDALTSALTTVGSIGKRIADNLDLTVSSRASQTSLDTLAGDTSTGITAIKNQTDQFTFSTGGVDANVAAIGGDTTPAGNLQIDYDGTGYNKTNSEIFAVTTLPSLESVLSLYFSALTRKDAGLAGDIASVFTTINQDYGSGAGAYDNTTDSVEAIRDRGDAAWTGGGGLSAQDVRDAMTLATAEIPAALSIDDMLTNITNAASIYPNLLATGVIDALTSQTEFDLDSNGSPNDDAYIGRVIVITAAANARQKAVGVVRTYTAATKTIELEGDPGIFTMAAGDLYDILAFGDALTAQQVRDALKLAPTAGSPAAGSVDTHLDDIEADTQNIQSRIPASLVSGRMDSDVGSIQTNAITGTSISSGAQETIADAILKRDWTAVTGEAARSVLNALRFLRNKWSVSGSTLTVTKENDSTAAWTATVTTDAAADPVTGSDPA